MSIKNGIGIVVFAIMVIWAPFVSQASEKPIPDFTPNVVDPHHYLSFEETQQINTTIETLAQALDVFSAVYLEDTLGEETIEDLASRAFKKWKLGNAGQDNGLLLTISVKDRRMRFEVGYGLESTLTDTATHRVLDNVFAPLMRNGQLKEAIKQSLSAAAKLNQRQNTNSSTPRIVEKALQGFLVNEKTTIILTYLVFFCCLWILPLLVSSKVRSRLRHFAEDPEFLSEKKLIEDQLDEPFFTVGRLGLFTFLSINPGVFIAIAGSFPFGGMIAIAVMLGLATLFTRAVLNSYSSANRFRKALEKWKKAGQSGSISFPGGRSRGGSSSSGSSSSSFSSSGGGSSGGGGSSSSW